MLSSSRRDQYDTLTYVRKTYASRLYTFGSQNHSTAARSVSTLYMYIWTSADNTVGEGGQGTAL